MKKTPRQVEDEGNANSALRMLLRAKRLLANAEKKVELDTGFRLATREFASLALRLTDNAIDSLTLDCEQLGYKIEE